jgi:ribosomal-protein-alanine N-acetyltransferase
MTLADLDAVGEIERLSFPVPWPLAGYQRELTQNRDAHYFVACAPGPDPAAAGGTVVGHAGLWMQYDEAHISTLAVHPAWRGRGVGARLLMRLIDCARERGAVELTLEVRASNTAAQRLYERFGFEVLGRRPGYYADSGEDALIMTSPDPTDPAWQAHLAALAGLAGSGEDRR